MSDQSLGSSLLTEGGGNPDEQQHSQPQGQLNNAPNGQQPSIPPNPSGASNWRDSLPEDLKGNASLQKITDTTALATSYVNLEKLLGSEKVPLPKSEDDQDGWNRVYTALGRPEAPDKYDIKVPDLPQDINAPYDQDEEKFWRELAHKNGISQRQFANIWDAGIKSRMDKAIAWSREATQAKTQAADSLKREWGQNYDGNLNTAKTGFRKFADPDFAQYLDETGLGNDPRMTRFMYKVGRAMNGQTKIEGQQRSGPSVADLDRQAVEYRTKFNAELMDKTHPNHEHHVKQLTRIYEARFGGDE